MVNVDYPGHWPRTNCSLVSTFEQLKYDVLKQIDRFVLSDNRIIVFGHSMGAILAWEIALFYMQKGIKIDSLFLSGSNSPESFSEDCKVNVKTDDQLLDLADYKTQNHSNLENQCFYRFFLPVMKNDLGICSSYQARKSYCDVKTTIIYGDIDRNTEDEKIRKWEKYTNCISIIRMKGKHMYLDEIDNRKQITKLINDMVRNL